MEVIEGERVNLFVNNGYLFANVRITNGVQYVKCKINGCTSRASFRLGQDEEVRPGPHNHPPDVVAIEVLQFKAELKRRAATERRLTLREIFDEVSLHCVSHNPTTGRRSSLYSCPSSYSCVSHYPTTGRRSSLYSCPSSYSCVSHYPTTGRRSSLYSCPSSYSCVSRSPSRRSSYNSKRSRSAS
ncbi:hypothetical protein J6590_099881 [Homalodisca vitripennis]|nr:hypothetical protein J6590_099881 [Homalodisca vitripennis]